MISLKKKGDNVDDKNLDVLKQNTADNSKLEEILKKEITPAMQSELFDVLRQSQLYLPVKFSANMFEGIENPKEGDVFQTTGKEGFDINYLTDSEGNKLVPLFTSSEVMTKTGLESSAMVMFVEDLADMLKESDRYSAIVINPLTDEEIILPWNPFISLFAQPDEEEKTFMESLNVILDILREKYVELEDDYAFFVRGEEPFMKQEAVDGVFVPNIPFNISSRREFKSEWNYLNILLLPKTTKIVPIGNVDDEDAWDTIIAPGSEFEQVEEIDEYTTAWICRAQPFYDDSD